MAQYTTVRTRWLSAKTTHQRAVAGECDNQQWAIEAIGDYNATARAFLAQRDDRRQYDLVVGETHGRCRQWADLLGSGQPLKRVGARRPPRPPRRRGQSSRRGRRSSRRSRSSRAAKFHRRGCPADAILLI
jgi:hypothetical protein